MPDAEEDSTTAGCHRSEHGPPVRVGEGVQEQPRSPGAAGGVGPVGRFAPVQHGVVDPGVVGQAALGRQAELLEHGLRVLAEGGGGVQGFGQPGHDPQLAAHPGRGSEGPAAAEHAALEVGQGAFLLGPLGDRQDEVGLGGGLGEEEVADHQEVQAPQAGDHGVGVRRGNRHVGAVHEEAADAVGLSQRLQQLYGGQARAGNERFRDAPHGGHVGAGGGIGDLAVAGELVRFLAVFAAALAVALAGERAVAAACGAGEAQQQGEVDGGGGGVRAVDVLFHAAAREDVAAAPAGAVGQPAGGVADQPGRDAGEGLYALGPVGGHAADQGVVAGRAGSDVAGVGEALVDHHVGEPQQQGEVGAGQRLQVQAAAVGGERGGGGAAGVHHDQAAGVAGALQVLDEGRHGLGDVGAEHQDGAGGIEVLQREGQAAVQAERAHPGRGGGGHAEPAVVVDPRRAQRQPGELAQLVRLLVGQPAAAEDSDGVRPVPGTGCLHRGRDAVQGLIPADRAVDAVGAPEQRLGDAAGVVQQRRRGPALAAQAAAVGGEVASGHVEEGCGEGCGRLLPHGV